MSDVSKKTEIASQTSVDVKREADTKVAGDSVITTTTKKVFIDGTAYTEVSKQTIASKYCGTAKPEIKKTIVLDDSYAWKVIGLIFVLVIFVTMVYGRSLLFL